MTFDQWFNQTEAFSLRGERFYDDLITYKLDGVEAEHFVKWLKAAYDAGHDHAMNRLVDDGK